MAKYQIGIIFISRNGLQIYIPGLPSILEFKFIQEIVKDLDIVNKKLLFDLLKMFITDNHIPKTSFIIVVSDSASIIKDFINPPQTDQQDDQPVSAQKQADEFIEHIPFEEVSSKSFPIENGIRAYGTNKELHESIKEAFILEGFEILMVIPGIAFSQEIGAKAFLDADSINLILKKELLVKHYNLLNPSSPLPQPEKKPAETTEVKENTENAENTEVAKQEKSGNKRIIILVSVFIALIIILIIVYINQPKI